MKFSMDYQRFTDEIDWKHAERCHTGYFTNDVGDDFEQTAIYLHPQSCHNPNTPPPMDGWYLVGYIFKVFDSYEHNSEYRCHFEHDYDKNPYVVQRMMAKGTIREAKEWIRNQQN
jgi:hypothetical protein